MTALMLAANKGHFGCAEVLLNNGANVNALNTVSSWHSALGPFYLTYLDAVDGDHHAHDCCQQGLRHTRHLAIAA